MKNQTFTVVGKLSVIERKNNSLNGNPRYQFAITDSEGEITALYTGVDSMYGYSITNYENKQVEVSYTLKRGKYTLIEIK